jgi:uncharacterized protein YndB with AHSA1/START domain
VKRYRETHEHEGVVDAPIERVWALHTDAEAMCSLSDRVLAMDVVEGRMGEVGCLVSTTLRTPSGRVGTADSEVIEAEFGRRIVIRGVVREEPAVTLYSTWEFRPEGNRTHVALSATVESQPAPGLARLIVGFSREKRERESAVLFAQEIADENAYFKRHRDEPAAH